MSQENLLKEKVGVPWSDRSAISLLRISLVLAVIVVVIPVSFKIIHYFHTVKVANAYDENINGEPGLILALVYVEVGIVSNTIVVEWNRDVVSERSGYLVKASAFKHCRGEMWPGDDVFIRFQFR